VVRQRIARARAFLATEELSISQISEMVGFRTPSHFATVFHRIVGVTPSAYRAQHLDPDRVTREGGRDAIQ